MSSTIAKKYAKAMIAESTDAQLAEIGSKLRLLAAVQSIPKYQDIVTSPDIRLEQKSDLLIEIAAVSDAKLKNFIRLLAEKKRLPMIGEIAAEIQNALNAKNGAAEGFIDAGGSVDAATVATLERIIGEKIGMKLTLSVRSSDYTGMRVEIPAAGQQIELPAQGIKNQMIDHILKAI